MTTERVPLANVDLDPKIHTRAELDAKRVESYAKLLKAKEPARFPPVVLYFDGTTYWVADGYHRCHAHLKAELADIEAIVHQGGSRDAFLAGLAYDQGAPKSREDKRQNVLKALADPEWAKWSNRVIARHCGVSDPFVGKLRKNPPVSPDSEKIRGANVSTSSLGADGKKYNSRTAKKRPKPVDQDVQTSDNPVLGNSPVHTPSESGNLENPEPEDTPEEQLDFTDEIFQKDGTPQADDFAELTGETAAEVIEAGGLTPVNVEPEPEGWDTERVLTPGLLARVAETIGFSNEKWVLGLLEQLGEHPDPVVREGAANGIENHEGVRTENPLQEKRNALPADWVEILYEIYMVANESQEAYTTRVLRKVLDKVQGL